MIVLWFFLGALLLFLTQRAVYTRFWNRRLSMTLRFDPPAVTAGQQAAITEVVENRKLLPLPMFRFRYGLCRNFTAYVTPKGTRFTVSVRAALPARRRVRCRTELPALPRGIYTVSDAVVQGQDLFCTASMEAPVSDAASLTVYPEKLPASKLQLPYRLLLGTILTRHYAQEDPFEIRNIRPYEPYDSMRSINWKASARTGSLKVNQHDHTTDEALQLILDTEHGTPAQRETVISLASSLCSLFLRRGIAVSVCACSRSCIGGESILVPSGSGVSHQRVIDENLARIKLGATVLMPFDRFLLRLGDTAARKNLCTVISAGASPEISRAFDLLCSRNGGYYIRVGGGAVPGGRNFTVLPYEEREVAV